MLAESVLLGAVDAEIIHVSRAEAHILVAYLAIAMCHCLPADASKVVAHSTVLSLNPLVLFGVCSLLLPSLDDRGLNMSLIVHGMNIK